jgi:hypothetical protein
MNRVLLFALTLTILCATAMGQARLTGTVTDSSGAVVVGAGVTVRNTATGLVDTVQTGGTGTYSIAFLNPGHYEISCELSGFKKFVRSGIVLETGTTTAIDITLDLGQITEVVSVSSSTPLLESESGALGQLIENKLILNMPIQSRRGAALVRLMGNISFNSEEGGQSIPRFSLAGGRSYNQLWQLDGAVAQNQASGSPQLSINPPNESLQEFKVMANNYPAEFGRTGSGLILMTTRSGSNDFHGSAYEWLRNDKLNARTFFSPGKAPLRYNIFGASLGGPIKRNKTFFFYNYEGGRRRTGVTVTRNVPHPAELNGDFSARTDIRVLDPATRVGTTAAQPFPGNVIPQSRIDPVGRAFAAFYPAPNQPGNNPARAPSNNFLANGSDSLRQDFHTARIDHQLSQKDRLFGRFTGLHGPEGVAAVFPVAAADDRAGIRENENRNYLVSWQRNLRPTLINEARYSFGTRKFINRGAGTGSGLNSQLNLRGVDPNALARVTLTGHSALGQSTHERLQSPIGSKQFIDSLMWVKGSHSIKTGFEYRRSSNKEDLNSSIGGAFAFTDRATNSGVASLLLGWTNSAALVDSDIVNSRGNYYAGYIQDDWKVTSKLTLNLGLRWEMDSPRFEAQDRQSGFDPFATNPVSGTRGVITFAGRDGVGRYSHDFDANNWGPRFGFAYRVTNGLVVRGGYGIFYNGAYQVSVNNSLIQGFSINGSFQSPDGGFTPAFLFRNGMPAIARQELTPGFGAVRVGQAITTSPDFIARDHANGYAQQWNFTIQKELPGNTMVEAAYLANVGHKLSGLNLSINQIPLVNGRGPAVQAQTMRPFPQFGNVTSVSPSWGNSSYHSMNVKFEKRYAAGLTFLGNYTWAKFIDDVEGSSELGGGAGDGYQHMDARGLDKALAGADLRHRLAFSSLFDLPFGKGRRWSISNSFFNIIAGGWTVGGILETRAGAPYGVIENTNRLNAFSGSQRPHLLYDPNLSGDRSRAEKIQQYFDTAAFRAPGEGILGTAGRTNGLGPGFFGLDLSVHKLFQLSERFGLTFRTDIVNFPNVPAFAAPNQQRGDGNFGRIGSVLGLSTGREIQLSLRLAW